MLRGTADMYVGMSQIACERGDLEAATTHLLRSQELGEHTGLPQNPYRWRVAMAGVRESQGDLAGALTLLDEAQRVYMGDFSPNVRPVPALRARLLAAQGQRVRSPRLGQRAGLVRGRQPHLCAGIRAHHPRQGSSWRGTRSTGDKSSLNDADHGCCSACSAAAGRAAERQRDRDPGVAGTCPPSRRPTPRVPWHRWNEALTLAEPEGYVRVFAGEGPPMASLLTAVTSRQAEWDYVRRLLAAGTHDGAQVTATAPGEQATRRRYGPHRSAQRTRTRRAAAAGNRPGRTRHRTTALRFREHDAHPHQEHLRQARSEQPTGSGPSGAEFDMLPSCSGTAAAITAADASRLDA